jgi:tRNA 2-thiouridine synthesizing protein E
MPKKLKAKRSTRTKAKARAKPLKKVPAKTATRARAKRAGKTAPATQMIASASPPDAGARYTLRQTAPGIMYGILHPDLAAETDPSFPDAPDGWTKSHAEAVAAQSGLELTDDHWEIVRVLQGCYKDEVSPRLRLLRDALEARFAAKGGMKYLYVILTGGPIAQGCTLAGLKAPAGARDLSFGSVA